VARSWDGNAAVLPSASATDRRIRTCNSDDVAFDTVHDLIKLAIEVERLVAEAMRAWAAPRPVSAWAGGGCHG
jgi:hypothetical protein